MVVVGIIFVFLSMLLHVRLTFTDRYTPANQGVAFNSGAKQRIIRMVEVQKDPMEPPRFK